MLFRHFCGRCCIRAHVEKDYHHPITVRLASVQSVARKPKNQASRGQSLDKKNQKQNQGRLQKQIQLILSDHSPNLLLALIWARLWPSFIFRRGDREMKLHDRSQVTSLSKNNMFQLLFNFLRFMMGFTRDKIYDVKKAMIEFVY